MRARLDSKDASAWDSSGTSGTNVGTPGTSTGTSGISLESWSKEAAIFVERELDCAISTPTEELVAASEMASTAQYLCTIRQEFTLGHNFVEYEDLYLLTYYPFLRSIYVIKCRTFFRKVLKIKFSF